MKLMEKIRQFIAVVTCFLLVFGCSITAQAAWNPYPLDGGHGEESGNCTWRAWQETYDRLGIELPKWGNAKQWYKGAADDGYTVVPWIPGNYVPSNSIAVWNESTGGGFGHVAFVANADENGFTLIEGNFSPTDENGPFYSRWEQYWAYGERSSGLIGFIVLEKTPSVTTSVSWSNSDCQPDASNVYVYIEADSNVSGSFTEAGITVWNDNGDVVAQKSENPGVSGKHLNIWYNITEETGVVLQSGTSYKYQFYTVFNDTRYDSSIMSFQTTGQPPVHQEENSWTQELNIENWTYGEDGNTPTATAKYGTVVFSYSTEKEGVYTSEIPQNAGTYYVKATVTETDQYSGLEAVKEFKIEKATPQYTVPAQLSMTYGERLGSIELPDGFSWKDETEASGNVGEKTAYVIYTPEDCNNYHVVNDIPVTITVEPKNLSGMVLDGINSLDDLNRYQMKDGDTVLIKDVDYVIFPYMTQDEKHVLVMVTFLGNYTGTTETTFALDDSDVGENEGNPPVTDDEDTQDKDQSENEDKDQNKDQDEDQQSTAVKTVKSQSPKTGDDSNIFIWGILLLLSGVGASSVIVYGKIQKKTH